MAAQDPIDEPSPTIVGPQPPQAASRRRMSVPRGLEKLLALACLTPEWRARVLTDPLKAAEEAGLELSDNEKAVIRSVPKSALEPMIDSFGRAAGSAQPRPALGATLAAASALLAASLSGCDKAAKLLGKDTPEDKQPVYDYNMAPGGVRADEPPSSPGQSAIPNKPYDASGDRILVGPLSGTTGKKDDPKANAAPGGPIEQPEAKPEASPQVQPAEQEPPDIPVSRGIGADIP